MKDKHDEIFQDVCKEINDVLMERFECEVEPIMEAMVITLSVLAAKGLKVCNGDEALEKYSNQYHDAIVIAMNQTSHRLTQEHLLKN